MAPRVGFEPTANRLTADCSTTELPRNRARYLARLDCDGQRKFVLKFPNDSMGVTPKKMRPGEPGPKALGNGGVSSRKTGG